MYRWTPTFRKGQERNYILSETESSSINDENPKISTRTRCWREYQAKPEEIKIFGEKENPFCNIFNNVLIYIRIN